MWSFLFISNHLQASGWELARLARSLAFAPLPARRVDKSPSGTDPEAARDGDNQGNCSGPQAPRNGDHQGNVRGRNDSDCAAADAAENMSTHHPAPRT